MQITLDLNSVADYETFLRVKRLPQYRIRGRIAEFPDEYAAQLGLVAEAETPVEYEPHAKLFDYQRDIAKLAIEKQKYAVFAECGLGKTLIMLEFARHAATYGPILIVSPLMVVQQTINEAVRFYGEAPEQIAAKDLQDWLDNGNGIGITNYEAIRPELTRGNLAGLVLDESSLLKSHYGKWGTKLIELGRGLSWKLALTGTPAPNDRIEYANHAVFLDAFPTVNSFLAKYFVNRGQTDNRWELKPHALGPFYRSLSHWSIFVTSPATYGWQDNCENIPPIHVHIHDVDLTKEQEELAFDMTGEMFGGTSTGGIVSRGKLSQIAKGHVGGQSVDTNKPAYVRSLADSWPDESTIIWCWYNAEQELLEKEFPEAASIKGSTPIEERQQLIAEFQTGFRKVLISKPKVLGFGLNLQIATRQIFSGLVDSYEAYWQAVKRSNRVGSMRPLNVHIPVTDLERPMIETVLRKAARVQEDTEFQEQLFRKAMETVNE